MPEIRKGLFHLTQLNCGVTLYMLHKQHVSNIYHLTLYGPCIVINLHNKNQRGSLSFYIFSNEYPLHVSNRLTIYLQEAVTVHAVYGIYRASTVTSC